MAKPIKIKEYGVADWLMALDQLRERDARFDCMLPYRPSSKNMPPPNTPCLTWYIGGASLKYVKDEIVEALALHAPSVDIAYECGPAKYKFTKAFPQSLIWMLFELMQLEERKYRRNWLDHELTQAMHTYKRLKGIE